MRVFYKMIGNDSQVELKFDAPAEEYIIFEAFRSGFLNEKEKDFSRKWNGIEENRAELNNAFTQTWLLRDIAIHAETKDFKDMLQSNPAFVNMFRGFSLEVSKMMLVFISSLSETKFKGLQSSQQMKKRLSLFREILRKNVGSDFKYKNIKLPDIKVSNEAI